MSETPTTPTRSPAANADARSYRKTLNLPKTAFPMKANLVQNEPASLKRWAKQRLYEQVRDARKDATMFRFHDGPPYANGSLHLGHLLNKSLKDFVVRSRTMMEQDCPYIPGWDCHGLPIEHKVMSEMSASGKLAKLADLPDDTRRMAIRNACKTYAQKYIKLQSGQMQRLLTLADYDNPYRTMDKQYEADVLELFADLVEKRLVYRDLKSVHWSIENQTALAEAELEHYDREDESVYVEFDADDKTAVAKAFGLAPDDLDRTPTFMIWTTTPWTLPANLVIAVNPKASYALVDLGGTLTVIAEDLIERISKAGGCRATLVAKTTGDKLVSLHYHHPLIEDRVAFRKQLNDRAPSLPDNWKLWRLVAAKHVTLDDGTGLVHTAPGHGREDELVGRAHFLPMYCPVQQDGTYDDSVPEDLQSMLVWDANPKIVQQLRDSGHLYHSETITHSYPHDWRGKSPVIFRATRQWFIRVDPDAAPNHPGHDAPPLRGLGLQATESAINFVPQWGKSRMRGMLESRPDWCISRQRSWGLPIPAFRFKPWAHELDYLICTPRMVRAVANVVREKGSNAWFTLRPAELLRDYSADDWSKDVADGFIAGFKEWMKSAFNLVHLEKAYDIFDVWFESGSSWRAVMEARGFGFPCDLYLEGSDQHRGWFQVSLLTALGVTGKPPFKTLLTHGFMVDKEGKAMSKSVGNTLEVADLLKDFGADVCRWWVSSLSYENDIKADQSYFQAAGESYRKVRNTLRFMLSNLGDFTPSPPGCDASNGEGHCVALADFPPTSLDAWVMGEYRSLLETVRSAYERFNFREAHHALYDFCNETLSSIYLAAVKDRLYCDTVDSPRRRRTQTTLWDLTDGVCRLLAPLIPHTADEAWRALKGADAKDTDTTIHIKTFHDPASIDAQPHANWPEALRARGAALTALERKRAAGDLDNPLDAGIVLPSAGGALDPFANPDGCTELADLLGVSRVRLDPQVTAVSIEDLRSEPRCERSWKRDGTVRERSGQGLLCDRCARAIGAT